MDKLSIQEVASVLVEKSGLKRKEAEQFAVTMFDIIKAALLRDRLVKIKGFGTFKIIDIDARESVNVNTGERVTIEGHERVTFTPEAIMKTLVNKPFSQFETVVLNDGVVFDDLGTGALPEEDDADDELFAEDNVVQEAAVVAEAPQDAAEEENPVEEQPVPETEPSDEEEQGLIEFFVPEETLPVEEEETDKEEEPVEPAEESAEPAEEPAEPAEESAEPAEEPVEPAEEPVEPAEEPAEPSEEPVEPAEEPAEPSDEYPDEPDHGSSWGGWKTVAVAAVACLLGFGGGYYWGSYRAAAGLEPITVLADSIDTEEPDDATSDTLWADTVEEADTAVLEEAEAPVPEATPEASVDETATKDYGAMDARVRLGAYRIVGTDQVVKAKEGQDIGAIARRLLGPGMECYLEVVNGIKSGEPLKAGQEIIIPKLEHKKKKQR